MNLFDELNRSFSNFFDNKNETNLFKLIKICLYALWKTFLLYSIFIPIPKRNINFQSFDDVRIPTYKDAFDFIVFRIGFILIAFSVNIYSWDIYFYNKSPLTSAILFFAVGLVMIFLMYDKDINTKK